LCLRLVLGHVRRVQYYIASESDALALWTSCPPSQLSERLALFETMEPPRFRRPRCGQRRRRRTASGAIMSNLTAVTIRSADTIWHERGGWFDARWHFSFDRYRDPEQNGVGALRVFNDDRITAGAEWPMHPHRDIESLT
jgi:hypothetical protein